MFGFSLGVGLANRFVAWWGDWRLALDFTAGRYHPKGAAGLVLTETRASSAMVLQSNGTYVERAAGELAIGQGVGLQVSVAVTNLFLNPTLQGHTSWLAGGDGDCDLTANAGLDPTGAEVATVVENQASHNYGSQFYQGVAIVDTEMTISMWAYADEEVAGALKLNDNENSQTVTIGTTMQRFDHTGTIGPALLGGGLGRCGFQSGEDWRGKGVVIAWMQINVGGPAPFAIGTRAADNPVVVQGLGDELMPSPMFDDLDGWLFTNAVEDTTPGNLVIENVAASEGHAAILPKKPLIAGALYQITTFVSERSGAGGGFDIGGTRLGVQSAGWNTLYAVAGNGSVIKVLANSANMGGKVVFDSIELSQVLPYPGYNTDGTLSGREGLEGGGFDTQEDVDLWTVQAATLLSLSSGAMRVENAGANYGGSAKAIPTTAGRVYALDGERSASGAGAGSSDCHLGGTGSHNKYVSSGEWADGPFYSLVEEAFANISATVGGDTDGAWKEHDNISLQEVEPGVVIEVEAVLNITPNQYVMWLMGPDSNNGLIIRCRGGGFFNMIIKKDGTSLFDVTSSEPYPDGVVASIRLEITDTPDGCFFAVFKDGVVIPGLMAGPIAYPEAINTLSLIPVAGVKTIKEIYGK